MCALTLYGMLVVVVMVVILQVWLDVGGAVVSVFVQCRKRVRVGCGGFGF